MSKMEEKNNKGKTVVWRGKTSFAKILGDPLVNEYAAENFGEDRRFWSMDLEISDALAKEAKALGIDKKVKRSDNYLDGKPFITFKQAEYNKAPDPYTGELRRNDPIKVVDINGNPWDQDKLIGNGSVVDVKFTIRKYGANMGVYIRGVRVLDHVPYVTNDFEPLDENDEFFDARRAAELNTFKKDFGLIDDDISDVGEEEAI